MFKPLLLAIGIDKATAMKQSKLVYLDEERDNESRWNALEYLAMNLTGGDTIKNPRRIERGDVVEAENMGYSVWCCDSLHNQVLRY